jgi:hypothetical protein
LKCFHGAAYTAKLRLAQQFMAWAAKSLNWFSFSRKLRLTDMARPRINRHESPAPEKAGHNVLRAKA